MKEECYMDILMILFHIMIPIAIANKIFVFRQNVVFVIQGREDQTFS